jgi:hypothetical protein
VPVGAVGCGEGGCGLDARAEAVRGGAQRQLRVDLQLAGHVDRREQHVADLVERGLAVALRLAQLVELARDGVVGDPLEVEAAGRRAPLHLARVERTRQVLGHLAEQPGLAPLLRALDLVPVAQDLAGALHLHRAEDVRVPADQLLAAVLGHLGERAGAALLEEQRQEVDLEEHVPELVQQLRVVAVVGGLGELVGLLDRVRHDRALVLLAVPGALAPQPARELVEAPQRLDVPRLGAHPAGAPGVVLVGVGVGFGPLLQSEVV